MPAPDDDKDPKENQVEGEESSQAGDEESYTRTENEQINADGSITYYYDIEEVAQDSSSFVMNKLMSEDMDNTVNKSIKLLEECKALVNKKDNTSSEKFDELMESYSSLIELGNELIKLGRTVETLVDVKVAQARGYKSGRDQIINLANKLSERSNEVSEIISKINNYFYTKGNKAVFSEVNRVLRNDLESLRSRFDDFCKLCSTALRYMRSAIVSMFTGSYRPYIKETKVNIALNTMMSNIFKLDKMIGKISTDYSIHQTSNIEHLDKSILDDTGSTLDDDENNEDEDTRSISNK